jgi:hypothetical protein
MTAVGFLVEIAIRFVSILNVSPNGWSVEFPAFDGSSHYCGRELIKLGHTAPMATQNPPLVATSTSST